MQRLKSVFVSAKPPEQPATLREHLTRLHDRLRESLENNHVLKAKIDAARSDDENKRHWVNADYLGPNAAYDADTRSKLRSRGRYETINNSYLKGLVRSLSYDLIGTGPRPQIVLSDGNTDGARAIERRFAKWARRKRMGRKYRTLHKSLSRCGAGLMVFSSNARSKDPVQFNPRPVEIDLLETPPDLLGDPRVFDGIRVDDEGEPVEYYFLKDHPGERMGAAAYTRAAYTTVPAERVVHWYFEDRPQQYHGIPEITSALPLFNHLRRYSAATLTAAEFAALMAGILKTSGPPGTEAAPAVTDWQMFEVVRGALMALPATYELQQLRPEQPTTTFPEFERIKLKEAGRSCGAPLNVTTGSSEGYNFSSSRSDMAPYQGNHWIDRDDFETIVAEPVFYEWAAEAVMIDGYLPGNLPPVEEWLLSHNWDGFPELDQTKSAGADDTRLRNGTATLSGIWTERDGANWREKADQLVEEIEYFHSKGIQHPYELQVAGQAVVSADTGGEDPAATPPPAKTPPPKSQLRRNGFSRNGVH